MEAIIFLFIVLFVRFCRIENFSSKAASIIFDKYPQFLATDFLDDCLPFMDDLDVDIRLRYDRLKIWMLLDFRKWTFKQFYSELAK